jgi:hypothetical protein
MEVQATVVLPVSVQLDVPDDMPIEEIKEKVLDMANDMFNHKDAVIHDSNLPELID